MADGDWLKRGYVQMVVAKVIAQAWQDDAFRRRLLSEPAAVLRENGVEVPSGVRVVAHLNTATEIHFVIPERPDIQIADLGPGPSPWCTTMCTGLWCTL